MIRKLINKLKKSAKKSKPYSTGGDTFEMINQEIERIKKKHGF